VKLLAITTMVLTFFAVAISETADAADHGEIKYRNQRGSMMVLNWHSDKDEKANTGTLTGTFTSTVGCKAGVNKPMPIMGVYSGNAISLSINFPECHSVVAITGNINADASELQTLWLRAGDVKDAAGKNWDSNVVGSDYFRKVNVG
jgi:hypothetical protein